MTKALDQSRAVNPLLKLALELGPLVVFFVANSRGGLFVGTGAFMVATVVALSISWALTRRIPIMPLVSGAVVLVFGGLTLALQDELFIKLKPTIVNLLFAGALFGGVAFNKPLLAIVFDQAFDLTHQGWMKLSTRWAWFFVFLAVVNEVVWRTQTTDFWVAFKVWGIMPITLIFAMAQAPLLQRYSAAAE
ncbi:septation protein A [Chenggangzhangella methanolivorans]|uniref:Inner membrane-spanning protein YciB n=1 Tax=Chenggangzhangella methanolivorans TaxID=1437009 RepID=A0A9E6UJZ0_9HYPH|nr:septation protein A [Chenggangzhangella methanolivorans]QZN98621.1 septation protein A [Chenggangzhangella methanolivorans]